MIICFVKSAGRKTNLQILERIQETHVGIGVHQVGSRRTEGNGEIIGRTAAEERGGCVVSVAIGRRARLLEYSRIHSGRALGGRIVVIPAAELVEIEGQAGALAGYHLPRINRSTIHHNLQFLRAIAVYVCCTPGSPAVLAGGGDRNGDVETIYEADVVEAGPSVWLESELGESGGGLPDGAVALQFTRAVAGEAGAISRRVEAATRSGPYAALP